MPSVTTSHARFYIYIYIYIFVCVMEAARWHTLWGSCKAKATFQVPVVNDMSSLLKWKMEDRSNSATGGWWVKKKKKRVGEKKVRRVQRWKIHERMLCDRAWKWGREGRREKGDGTDSGQRMGGSIGRKRRERERLGSGCVRATSLFHLLIALVGHSCSRHHHP